MKKFKSILLLALTGVMTLGITSFIFGCSGSDTVPRYGDPWKYKKEDQGFYYAVYHKDGKKTATILGLVDEESERDELVIPEKLGGYDVRQLGAIQQRLSAPSLIYGIEAKKIDKIFINSPILLADFGIKNFEGDLLISAAIDFTYTLENTDFLTLTESARSVQINIATDQIINYDTFVIRFTKASDYSEIVFESFADNRQTYSTINKNNEWLTKPILPTKAGYLFKGWFKDAEYQTEWNFDKDMVTENITLYAKWLAKEKVYEASNITILTGKADV